MGETFDFEAYMAAGVERVVKDAVRATLRNPRESLFMAGFAKAVKDAEKRRHDLEVQGEHIPPFLIASITSACNLHCAGCYSRFNSATVDETPQKQLTSEEWFEIFREADELGVSFILLAGGEPMLRRDIIQEAGRMKNILFPVFTNGTFMDERYLDLFDEKRNLVPVLSIEGNREITDARRGEGIYDRLLQTMEAFRKRGIIYGASVTVTSENLEEVTGDEFLDSLSSRSCKAVIFVEYVPVTDEADHLALSDAQRDILLEQSERLKNDKPEMVFVSFPGDEKGSGGCIAAGRGFFHINSHGGAEPCPFSPYSDINVKDTSLREAAKSKLFETLRDTDVLRDGHEGGCVLFEKREQVEAVLASLSKA